MISESEKFHKRQTEEEMKTLKRFVAAVKDVFCKHREENYVELVETLVKNNGKMDCRRFLKVHILD